MHGGLVESNRTPLIKDACGADTDDNSIGIVVGVGVPDGTGEASPVGVAAEDGALDEAGSCDGHGAVTRLGFGSRVGNFDGDESRGAFAVGGDGAGEVGADIGEGLLEFVVIRSSPAEGLLPRGAVGEDDGHVAGGSVAVDGDAVEGAIDGGAESGAEVSLVNARVGGQEGEHGGHVGMNHAGAFGDSDDAEGVASDSDFAGGDFGPCIGGHDAQGGFVPPVRRSGVHESGQAVTDFFEIGNVTDDAGGCDEDLLGLAVDDVCECAAHLSRGVFPASAGAGIGLAAVDDDSVDGLSGAEVLGGDDNRCSGKPVTGHAGYGGAGEVGDDDGQVGASGFFQTSDGPGGAKSGRICNFHKA